MIAEIDHKKLTKEAKILKSAEEVFFSVGYDNAKMTTIASLAGCSKVTVYSYFNSKENLYMAVTYKAMRYLIEYYYKSIEANHNKTGFESFVEISKAYLNFMVDYRNYADLLLNYLSLASRSSMGETLDKISVAMQNSIYYRKIRDIQNVPINIAVEEIKRGQKDGSIASERNPWEIHHLVWSMAVGYAKINYQPKQTKFLNANNKSWKQAMANIVIAICEGKI